MARQSPPRQSTSDGTPHASGENTERRSGNSARSAEALQHPVTLGFLFLCGLGVIHLLGVSPLPIGQLWGAVLLLVGAAGVVASFYWVYSLRYPRQHPGHQPGQEGPAGEPPGVDDPDQLQQYLEAEFTSLGSEAGLKSLAELKYEYQQVRAALDSVEGRDSLSATYIGRLAQETYRQGLKVLSSALELTRTIQAANRLKLEEEIAEMESEIAALQDDEAATERRAYKEETVNSHRERLSLLDQQQLRVDQLLYQAELCEASLARAHIELAALHAGEVESKVGTVTEALQSTIDRAREVQDELRQLGM